ncbi:unnamed protein product [Effrenium voratum]|uniref:Uncharacterized protein n=1 Tax=Effrenium voratum TaxID=2562239 RepID=A0AA36MXQ6_9DINO|nr:unnamed protein product [Effrenium voratum]
MLAGALRGFHPRSAAVAVRRLHSAGLGGRPEVCGVFRAAHEVALARQAEELGSRGTEGECGNYANSIMKAHGKAKPFGLELDELFALVAYAYDHPPAPPSANLWALLGSLVRERQLQEAGLFLRYFQQAVEKRTQRQPEATFLYCGMPEMNLTLEEGMYIYWRTFTSWTRHFQVARSAGAGVIRLTAHWVCEISEFSEYCVRNCVSEVILRPNQVLKVVACPGISEGHDIALDLLEEEEEEEESPF